jgi:hypothetical protein
MKKNFCKYNHDLSVTRIERFVKGKKRYECIECVKNQRSKRKKSSPYHDYYESHLRSKRKYYRSEKGIKQARKSNLKSCFGMSLEEYDLILISQNNVCAICEKKESAKWKDGRILNLSVDHCHKTGKIRGLLCQKCNRGIGYLDDDITIVNKALIYLKKEI